MIVTESIMQTRSRRGLLSNLLLLYLALIVLWPFYIELNIAPSVGINPQRLVAALIAPIFVFSLLKSGRKLAYVARHVVAHRLFYMLFFSYFFWRGLTAVASGNASSIFMVVYELISYFFVYFCFLFYIFKAGRSGQYLFVLRTATLLLFAFCVQEFFLQKNVLAQFATGTTRLAISADEVLRAGGHRIKGTFEHPLTLVQFVSLTMPMLAIVDRCRGSFGRRAAWTCASIVILMMTKSRSGLVFLLVVIPTFLFINYLCEKGRTRFFYATCLAATIPVLMAFYAVLTLYADDIFGRDFLESSAREAQVYNGIIAIKEHPLVGYGPGVAAGQLVYDVSQKSSSAVTMFEANSTTVDNRYLSILIESGIPGLLFFIAFNWAILYSGFSVAVKHAKKYGRTIIWHQLIGALLAIVGCLVIMFILSIFTVHTLYFIVLAVLMNYIDENKKSMTLRSFAKSGDATCKVSQVNF